VLFVRYELDRLPELNSSGEGSLSLKVIDHVLGRPIQIAPDLVILATAILPTENKNSSNCSRFP